MFSLWLWFRGVGGCYDRLSAFRVLHWEEYGVHDDFFFLSFVFPLIRTHTVSEHAFTSLCFHWSVTPDYIQSYYIWWHDWLGRWGESSEYVYLEFSKAFDTVSHNILQGKLRKCGLDEWSVRWVDNCLNGRAQSDVIIGAESSCRPELVVSPRGQHSAQSCSTSSSMTWMKS